MSTTVDNRVLEMRFDNAQFEKGVSTSMSTLDKLKKKLNLSGASKGLESLEKASKNINFSGMTVGINQVRNGMISLENIGTGVISKFTIIHNLTNSLYHAGQKMAKAFTIDPVKTGFQEYETQINAVQTILANTQSKGTTLDQVNNALDELNKYADLTIYNFTEMTRNIGTFTAAGVDLKTSVSSIQGIANLAAISGSTSQQASTAMYQLSQALAAGKVQLMDWNSVVNAGMGGQVFQDALKKTSELLGTGAEAAIEAKGSFRESLKEGWLTAEVLTQTLQKMTTSGANEYVAEYTGLTVEAVQASLEDAKAKYGEADAMKEASKALAEKSGKNAEEIEETLQMAKTAEEAATKVKTFTQLMDTLKEAVQSGWTQTWEILVGDFEEAKELFTGISNTLSDFINKSAESRNAVLSKSMTSNWDKLIEKINEAGVDTDSFNEKVKAVAKDSGVDIDKIITKYGSLEKAFQDGAISSDILNKTLKEISGTVSEIEGTFRIGDGISESSTDVEKLQTALEKAGFTLTEFGADGKFGKETEAAVKAFQEAHGLIADGIVGPETLKKLKEVSGVTGKLSSDVWDLVKNIDQIGGRQHIIEGFKNTFKGLTSIFTSIGNAWEGIFPSGTIEERSEKVLKLTESFHKFTENLIPTEEALNNVTRTFSGLFAVLDIIRTIAGGGLTIGFKVLSAILGTFDINLLEVTANIGDACIAFRDFLFSGNAISKSIDGLIDKLPEAISKFKEWFNTFKETSAVGKFLDYIENIKEAFLKFSLEEIDISGLAQSLGTNIANALMAIPDIAIQIGKDVIAGFQNGIKEGISGSIIGDIISFCTEFIAAFAAALGVHSPSTLTFTIAGFVIAGFILGLTSKFPIILDTIKFIGKQIINAFKFIWDLIRDENGNIEWGKIFAGGMLIGGILIVSQFIDAIRRVADGIGGINDIINGANNSVRSFTKVLNGYAWDLKAKAIQKMAISIAILAGAIWALAKIDDPGKLWSAVGVIAALAGIVTALALSMELMSKASLTYEKGKLNIEGLKASILQIGATLLMLAFVVKLIGDMNPDQAKQGFIGLAGMAVGLMAFMAIVGKLVKSDSMQNIDKLGKMMIKLSVAMLLMVGVVKLVSGLSGDEMIQGAVFATAFAVFVIAISKVAKTAGNNVSKVGGLMIKLTMAMGLMVGVINLIDKLSPSEMLKGAAFATAFVIFVKTLVKSTAIGKKQQIAKLGGLLMSISLSLLLMTGVCKLVGMLSVGDIVKGAAFTGAFLIFLKTLIKISSTGQGAIVKVGGTILALSTAVGILAGVAVLLGKIDTGGLIKGVAAVGILSTFMTMLAKSLKGAVGWNVHKSLLMLSVSIGAMALAVTALSLIDTADLAAATMALGSLMVMFALMTNSVKGLNNIKVGPLITMVGVVTLLAGIVTALSLIPNPNSTIEIVSSISVLMLALASTLEILDNVGKLSKGVLGSLAILALMAGGIGLVLTGLSKLNPGPTLEIATSISEVLIAMSTAALILSRIGPMGTVAAQGAAAMIGVVGAVSAILGVVGGLVAKIPGAQEFLNNGIPILESIGKALGSLIGGVIGGIGEGITSGLPGMIENIKTFMDGLSEVADKGSSIKAGSFDGVTSLVDAMVNIAVGSLFEKFASGIIGESSIEVFKTNATTFVDAITEISSKLNNVPINDGAITKAIKCGTLFSELANSLPKSGGMLQGIIGEQDLEGFGDKVKAFADEMLKVNEAVNIEGFTFNEAAITAISTAGTKFADLVNSLPTTGSIIVEGLFGKKDLVKFGKAITAFIDEIKKVNTSLGEDFTLNESDINSLITAGNKFVELQSALPRTGGWEDTIMGKDDLGTFGETVGAFAEALGTIKEKLGDTGITETTVTSITNAGNALVGLQEALPKEGWFDGKLNLTDFSNYITDFSDAIGNLGTIASELDPSAISTAISAAYNMKYLIEAISGIDTSGVSEFTGVGTGLRGADGPMADIGEAIAEFCKTVDQINITKVETSVSVALRLKSLITSLSGLDTSGIENFKIATIGNSIKNYGNSVKDLDPSVVASSVTSAIRLKDFISSLAGLDTSGVSNFASAISSLSKSNINGLLKSFSGASGELSNAGSDLLSSVSKGMMSEKSSLSSAATVAITAAQNAITSKGATFIKAGSTLMSKMISGFNSQKSKVISTVTSSISQAVSKIAGYYGSFYTNGRYLGDGLVSGINSKKTDAYNAGYNLGQAAVQGEKDGQKSKSPSKLTEKAGKWLGEGLVIGIEKMGRMVYNTGYSLGDRAANSISKSISKVSDMVNIGMNSTPTISPVLDLSNIESGVGEIGSLFDITPSVGVLSNLNSIGSSMNRRNQNGRNGDVILAIDKLRKELGNVGNTSYNINGITYDDGSAISEAVETLVRAAKIGRRR